MNKPLPECKNWKKYRVCKKYVTDSCEFNHQDDRKECPFYAKGFCIKNFFECPFKHVEKKICMNYALGFCPLGPKCENDHVKSVVSLSDETLESLANFPQSENYKDFKFYTKKG